MFKEMLREFILAMVKFFGWTTGVILAVMFWDNPVHMTFIIKEVVRNLLPMIIIGLAILILMARVTRKEEAPKTAE